MWRRHPFYLYLDEFHQFVDQAFIDAMTNLRKFGLRVTNAHQSQSQPPFDTPEGQSLLRTITANSRVKVLFRLDRPDAERMSRELIALSQRRSNFTAIDVTVGKNEHRSSSTALSSSRSSGTGQRSGTSILSENNTMRSDTGRSQSTEHTSGEQTTDGQSHGESRSATLRDVHYTLDGERELLINALQRLEDRQCLLSTAAFETRLVETPYVPDSFYAYVVENLPAVLLAMQRDRLLRSGERMVRLEPVWLLPAASTVELDQEVIDVEPIEQVSEVVLPAKEADDREVIAVRPVQDDEDPFLD